MNGKHELDLRTVMIYSQTVKRNQFERFAPLKIGNIADALIDEIIFNRNVLIQKMFLLTL